jgi:DNA mismatch repair protein MSH4
MQSGTKEVTEHRRSGHGRRHISANDDEDDKDNFGQRGFVRDDRAVVVIKFLSRASFDQTRGAELLRHVVRPDAYDQPTVVEEYTLLSACHAVLSYTQHCLGATFTRGCIQSLTVHAAGLSRMRMDRATACTLELLVNSKTGTTHNSLIGSIDCTKTVVGSRLLRTNLIAPPTRIATIQIRQELVDMFLGHEEFFFQVLDHLYGLFVQYCLDTHTSGVQQAAAV